jgi:hypothetical protein
MKYFAIFPYYVSWHYGRGYYELISYLKNFVIFVPTFFSIGTLSKTLVSPLYRIKEKYEGGFDISNLLEVTVVNLIMRIVGLVVRTAVILIGIISLKITFILSLSVIVIWAIIPFALPFAFIVSFISIFNNFL